jgi:diaminopimelate epimerase
VINPYINGMTTQSFPLAGRPFLKMHGLGNDFVVLDGRDAPFVLTDAAAAAIADRKLGVGCDQLIVLEPPQAKDADVFMRIRNADGGEVEACGNATRCVAHLVMGQTGRDTLTIETVAGLLRARNAGAPDRVTVDMGPARLAWAQIPLAEALDTLHVPVGMDALPQAVAVNMGNPHAVFFVADADAIDVAALGPVIEHHPLFPQRTNVEFVSMRPDGSLRMRVWERGVGITQACGTGACAALVAGVRRNHVTGRGAWVHLDGGPLFIEWRESDGHVLMTGPVATAFTGVLSADLVPAA